MAENTHRSIEAIHADIAEALRERERIAAERSALIEQIAAGKGKDADKGKAALLTVDYDVQTERLERLEAERYEATKAVVIDGYWEHQRIVAAARANAKAKKDAQQDVLKEVERMKAEAANALIKARGESDNALRARKHFLQDSAQASGYGQKLLDDIAEDIAAIEFEVGEGDAVNQAQAEKMRRERHEQRVAAEAERWQRFDDNWARHDAIKRGDFGSAQQ